MLVETVRFRKFELLWLLECDSLISVFQVFSPLLSWIPLSTHLLVYLFIHLSNKYLVSIEDDVLFLLV